MSHPSLLSVERCRYGFRETTEGIRPLIPELCLVGHVHYHTARPASFLNHRHPQVLEIFYVIRGKVTWWVEGISTDVGGNELCLVWPDEWHGARNHIVEPAEYYWVQVRLDDPSQGVEGGWLAGLVPDRHALPGRKMTGTRALVPLYQSLLREHASPEAGGEAVVRETLHLLLALVLRCSHQQRVPPAAKGPLPAHIARSLQWTSRNVTEATVADMVHSSGLDAVTFRKHFGALLGSSPSQYLARLRLQHAKERISRGISVTEIAHELGFSSSQYFATVFRKYEGFTPSEFRRRMEKSERTGAVKLAGLQPSAKKSIP